jgi:hypothetical protein
MSPPPPPGTPLSGRRLISGFSGGKKKSQNKNFNHNHLREYCIDVLFVGTRKCVRTGTHISSFFGSRVPT